MDALIPSQLLLYMALALFGLGLLSFLTGVIILARAASGKDMRTLATQTTSLAQKGIAQDVAGLVGNVSSLLDTMNQMVLTTSGVGIFLTILGLVLIGAACGLVLYIYQVNA